MSSQHRSFPTLAATLLLTASLLALAAAPASAAEPCPNEPFRVGLSANLPDCRAYEQVSPPYKEGTPIGTEARAYYAASPDGNSVIGISVGAFAGTENDLDTIGLGAFYEFNRRGSGWVAQALDPPGNYTKVTLADAGADLTRTLWYLHSSAQPEGVKDIYLRAADGTFTPVGPGTAGFTPSTATPAIAGQVVHYLGASDDLSRVLLSTETGFYPLWPGDRTVTAGATQSLYEYTGTENSEPRLVGVKNEGRLDGASYVNEGAELIGNCGTVLGGAVGNARPATPYNAISRDGSAVFFTSIGTTESGQCRTAAKAFQRCEEHGSSHAQCEVQIGPAPSAPLVNEVYARLNAEETLDISEPPLETPGRQCTGRCAEDEETEALRSPAVFEGASADGSQVFFSTAQPLVNEDQDNTPDLYMAELEGSSVKRLLLVSAGDEGDPSPGEGAEVQFTARVSEDGSHVYFLAAGALTGPNAEGNAPSTEPEAPNLYVYERDAAHPSGRLAFIATLASADQNTWHSSEGDVRPVQATPGGRYLAFQSHADLTPDDTSDEEAHQIFLYDAQAETLVRVSIGQRSAAFPAGYNEDGNTDSPLESPLLITPNYGGNDKVSRAASSLSLAETPAGDPIVVFESLDSLTPQAQPGLNSVYEYRDANVQLISSGQIAPAPGSRGGEYASQLLSIDASGEDVFFQSEAPLLAGDTDTSADFYDARIGGGFRPRPRPPRLPAQGKPAGPQGAAPAAQVPASASFSGPANPPPVHRKPHRHHHNRGKQHRRAHSHRGGRK